MLEVVCDWRSLYARHTVAKLGLIAPLRQASHFPVFDWLSTSLKYFAPGYRVQHPLSSKKILVRRRHDSFI